MEKTIVSAGNVEYRDDDRVTWAPYGEMTVKEYKKKIWKNILVLSFAFMLNYIAYSGLSSLQSSLHRDDGMGTICTSIRYMSLVISCIFVPKLMIRLVSHKWTITISLFGFLLWCAGNGIGVWASMVPASIINGFFVAPLWAAQGSYFTGLSREYARVSNGDFESRIGLFMGIYYAFYACAGVFGNVISTTVLSSSCDECNKTTVEEAQEFCGLNDCPDSEFENPAQDPEKSLVWTLCGIYMTVDACAILVTAVFVDHLPRHLVDDSGKTIQQEFSSLVTSSFRQMLNIRQLLLIPLTFYMGIEESFFGADFNKSWTWCALGIWMIGITNIPFALMGTVVSFTGGRVVKYVGRPPIFVTALIIDLMIQATLTFWDVNPEQRYVFFLIPAGWGSSDSIWVCLVGALYGTFFPDNSEAAFSNYMLWWCLGLAAGFGYSSFLCTNVKLIILFCCLWLGIICYFLAEAYHTKHKDDVLELGVDNKVAPSEHAHKHELYVITGSYAKLQVFTNEFPEPSDYQQLQKT